MKSTKTFVKISESGHLNDQSFIIDDRNCLKASLLSYQECSPFVQLSDHKSTVSFVLIAAGVIIHLRNDKNKSIGLIKKNFYQFSRFCNEVSSFIGIEKWKSKVYTLISSVYDNIFFSYSNKRKENDDYNQTLSNSSLVEDVTGKIVNKVELSNITFNIDKSNVVDIDEEMMGLSECSLDIEKKFVQDKLNDSSDIHNNMGNVTEVDRHIDSRSSSPLLTFVEKIPGISSTWTFVTASFDFSSAKSSNESNENDQMVDRAALEKSQDCQDINSLCSSTNVYSKVKSADCIEDDLESIELEEEEVDTTDPFDVEEDEDEGYYSEASIDNSFDKENNSHQEPNFLKKWWPKSLSLSSSSKENLEVSGDIFKSKNDTQKRGNILTNHIYK